MVFPLPLWQKAEADRVYGRMIQANEQAMQEVNAAANERIR